MRRRVDFIGSGYECVDAFDAEDVAEKLWKNSNVILDADDFDGVEFFAIGEVTE